MAITSFDISCDEIPTKSLCSSNSSKGGNSCRLLKINYAAAEGSLSSAASKRSKSKKLSSKSPYLADRVQLLSRVTEKRLVHKKTTDFVSSFPLAVNIYKANSDEFKSSKKANKKVKKSVLTLPNDPAPVPQVCTVSDMNDSEYCDKNDDDRKAKIIKKRTPIQNSRKARVREKDFEFYDRDAEYCSQLNINLDCSSTDMMKNFNGDGKRVSNKKKNSAFNKDQSASNNLNDVWAVLRNINRFQFRPSPPMSDESILPVKKKTQKRRPNHNDTRVIETCRTEEFAYISTGYELENKTPRSFSPSSSIDRITVIDKQNEFSKICEEFEKRLLKTHDFLKDSSNAKNRNQKIKTPYKMPKSNVKAIGNVGAREYKQLMPLKKKKKAKAHINQQREKESSENKDSLIDETLQIADNSDVTSLITDNDSVIPVKGSYVNSDCSESSNAELTDIINEQDSIKDESSLQSKVSSKITVNKEQETTVHLDIPKRIDPQKRKPRLVTTMPSSCMMPKLTQTEIKRRLANIRFPLVILGKDQVSSNIKVLNYDPPQFDGLDEHIWPFMKEWTENICKNKKQLDSEHINDKSSSYFCDTNSNKLWKTNNELSTVNLALVKDKKEANNDFSSNKKKIEIRRPTPCSEITEKLLQTSKKQKSIVQLKDKMLNFLYKKSSGRNVPDESHQKDENKDKMCVMAGNKTDATTETQLKPINVLALSDVPKRRVFPNPVPMISAHKPPNYAYPWAKAKWASEFIENVMKKIRSGVYYTQDHKDVSHKYRMGLKEVSVQAGSLCGSTDSTQTYDSETEDSPDISMNVNLNKCSGIPGFNKTLPLLEIKTLNKNQIAVKHCVTNVMVQFDVTVPDKTDKSTTSIASKSSLIPVEVTDSHTKIYKCKTTILNAMLPAELCSILPKMMSNIMDPSLYIDRPNALCPSKTDSCLSTITEQTRFENSDALSIIPSIQVSPKLKRLLQGRFSQTVMTKPTTRKLEFRKFYYRSHIEKELLPKVYLNDLLRYEVNPLNVEIDNIEYVKSQLSIKQSNDPSLDVANLQSQTYTSMEMYNGSYKRMSTAFKPFNIVGIIEGILQRHNLQINLNLTSYFDMLKMHYDGKNIEFNMSITNCNGIQKNVSVKVSNLKIDSLFTAIPKINNGKKNKQNRYEIPLKCIEYSNTSLTSKSENTEGTRVIGNKIKRKGSHKFYRKCKSTTNIPTPEKNPNTPLNKITNLEDFFQILGSKKMLCSVFDGYSAKKIMSSIIEMKNWITEINAKQALLILLLTNKKDTPNLVRFRPILLQGIAVNRITRASELDMEIEVIERENLNKFSQQYEGISYLPESVTNYDNLLEELYWIAKTTASDYQRPFDESSERLLKSLLEKRKKLNPSYLRVMARYVGLGLLKSPTKS